MVSGAAIGGVVAGSNGAYSGAATSLDSVRFNYLDHKEVERRIQVESKLKDSSLSENERQVLQQELAGINAIDKARDEQIRDICTQGNKSGGACGQLVVKAQNALDSYSDSAAGYRLQFKDIFPADYANAQSIMDGLDAGSITRDSAIKGIVESTGKPWAVVEKDYDTAMQLHGIASALAGAKLAADGVVPGKGTQVLKPDVGKGAATGTGNGTVSNGANETTGLLPKPGNTSMPTSGVGANSVFKVDNAQLGKKLGKHVEDFGGNASSAADRQIVVNKIHEIGNTPDKIISGTFSGQGANGGRGDVFFRIKGNDVVVTKPNGTFVTILKDGVTNNTSVKNALKGEP
jgi:hypothetical protein